MFLAVPASKRFLMYFPKQKPFSKTVFEMFLAVPGFKMALGPEADHQKTVFKMIFDVFPEQNPFPRAECVHGFKQMHIHGCRQMHVHS